MAKETVGYVHLEWTCPSCGGPNDGRAAKCARCGAPQPEDVQFEQAAEEQLIEDEQIIAEAEKGPDIHCPFCGTRNSAGATSCSHCLAELGEGTAREKGRVVGAHREGKAADITCPFCQTINPATAHACSNCGAALGQTAPKPISKSNQAGTKRGRGAKPIILVVLGLILAAACLLVFLTTRTEEMIGRVSDVEWSRMVVIEGLVPVTYEDWWDEIPAGAEQGSCRQQVRQEQDEPAPGADRVCGTPYTVDTGTGVGEVVEDCVYLVYDEVCEYTVEEWQQVDQAVVRGDDLSPTWPDPLLSGNQRFGGRMESYTIHFDIDGDRVTYTPNDEGEFGVFIHGSLWTLDVNTFNAVVGVQPAE